MIFPAILLTFPFPYFLSTSPGLSMLMAFMAKQKLRVPGDLKACRAVITLTTRGFVVTNSYVERCVPFRLRRSYCGCRILLQVPKLEFYLLPEQ